MAKLTLTDTSSGYQALSVRNANNDLIEAAVENTLSRDGTEPNMMEANIDMNSYRINNLRDGVNLQDAVTLNQLASGNVTVIEGVTLNATAVGDVLWPQSDAEADVGVTSTLSYYPPGYIERYGGVADGLTDSTAALETANSVGRQNIKFYETGRTDVLDTYTGRHRYYVIRDAFVDRANLIGPANLTSDGTQTDSIIRLGIEPDQANGGQWRHRVVQDIHFAGKRRSDNGITFGADGSPNNLTTAWVIDRCHFERPNIGIHKPTGNFGQIIRHCNFTSGNYGYYAVGYPVRTTIRAAEALGQTVISVTDTNRMNAGDIIRITVDDTSIHQTTIVSVDDANLEVTITDALDDAAAAGNDVKVYHPTFGVPVTLSHVGADLWEGGNLGGMRKAGIYYDGENAQGTGQIIIDGTIVEGNPGFGIFMKDLNNAYNKHRLRNVWFEANAKDANGYIEDADGIALAQTPSGAGNFVLDGAYASGGTFDSDTVLIRGPTKQISFTSDADESGDTYTITGTDEDGNAQSENVTGPNTTTVNSTKSYKTISSIATTGAGTGNITIGITGAVDFNDGQGPRTPKDIYCENVDGLVVEGSQIRLVEFIDSNVTLDHCTFESGITEITVTNTNDLNHLRITNAHINAFGESIVGASDVVFESVARVDRELGSSVARCWRLPQLTPTQAFEVPKGKIVETDRGDSGEDWGNTGVGADVSRDGYVEGLSYETATQYTFADGEDYLAPGVMAMPSAEVIAGKWYVLTMEIKVDSGLANVGSIKWGGGFNATRGNADEMLTEGEWSTIGIVGKLATGNTGNIRPQITIKTGGGSDDATITIGASQAIRFDDAQDAYDFYNRNIHIDQKRSSKRTKRVDTARASTTTLADDPELNGWNLQEDTWYNVEGFIRVDTNATADASFLFDFSNAAQTIDILFSYPQSALMYTLKQISATKVDIAGETADQQVYIKGVFQTNATTGGDVAFQWAQRASNAYSTTLGEGSWIKISKLHDEN